MKVGPTPTAFQKRMGDTVFHMEKIMQGIKSKITKIILKRPKYFSDMAIKSHFAPKKAKQPHFYNGITMSKI